MNKELIKNFDEIDDWANKIDAKLDLLQSAQGADDDSINMVAHEARVELGILMKHIEEIIKILKEENENASENGTTSV